MTKSNETRTTMGWNGADVWAFQQLLKKANANQLEQATQEIEREAAAREHKYEVLPLRPKEIPEVNNPNLTAEVISVCSSCSEEILDLGWPYCPGCGKRLVNTQEETQ